LKKEIEEWLYSYLLKSPIPFRGKLKTDRATSFQAAVWEQLRAIPFGKTLSYGAIAQNIGHPKAARAVGSACGKNPFLMLIPCHRAIPSNGSIGGFALDVGIKKILLEFEQDNL
jgi:O-6-methylguanine DNA methyltransferase